VNNYSTKFLKLQKLMRWFYRISFKFIRPFHKSNSWSCNAEFELIKGTLSYVASKCIYRAFIKSTRLCLDKEGIIVMRRDMAGEYTKRRHSSNEMHMTGDLGGLSPQNLRWPGYGPCIRPPNILRSSVCRMRANRVKKVSSRNYFLKSIG